MDQEWQRSSGNDTIAAIATPEGIGGIAIVRMSGPRAVEIMQSLSPATTPNSRPQSHRARHGLVCAVDGTALDEVLLLPMLAPDSYTGEDVIEFQCHGGWLAARLVLSACLRAGARPADAGEFTRRAFLNGRLTLDQAEAVADLIHAESEMAARAALQQLRGGMDREIARIEKPLIGLLVELEGGLEFSDDEREDLPAPETTLILGGALNTLEHLLSLADAGRGLREGISVVFAGLPNSGKSSLFNALLGRERAIVDHQAGTTRDYLSQGLMLDGHLFILHDTAGLHPDPGRVEALGIDKTLDLIAGADIILELQAIDQPLQSRDYQISTGVRTLQVQTKVDLITSSTVLTGNGIATSARDGSGLEELKRNLLIVAREKKLTEAVSLGIVLNQRHLHKLKKTREELRSLLKLVDDDEPGNEIIASLLSTLLAELGEVSGREYTETLLGEVFSRFCVGK